MMMITQICVHLLCARMIVNIVHILRILLTHLNREGTVNGPSFTGGEIK